jgi:hypothetical protein
MVGKFLEFFFLTLYCQIVSNLTLSNLLLKRSNVCYIGLRRCCTSIAAVGGDTIQESVRLIMRRLLRRSLALRFSRHKILQRALNVQGRIW